MQKLSEKNGIVSDKVLTEFPFLYHYTGAEGLFGILSEHSIRATHMGFLNDKAEQKGFFEQRLRHLLDKDFSAKMGEHLQSYCNEFGRATLSGPPCFTACLCKPPIHDDDDGLLSQWRGYGSNGGYAIVFDTAILKSALQELSQTYSYSSLYCLPVEYFPSDGQGEFHFSDNKQIEDWLRLEISKEFKFQPGKLSPGEFAALIILSSIYKNRGFREEQEVRIVTMPTPKSILEKANIKDRQEHPTQFRLKSGLLVPYIDLPLKTKSGKTPITRIIVGPHPDSEKRVQAVKLLLMKCQIEADVVASGTPYIG